MGFEINDLRIDKSRSGENKRLIAELQKKREENRMTAGERRLYRYGNCDGNGNGRNRNR